MGNKMRDTDTEPPVINSMGRVVIQRILGEQECSGLTISDAPGSGAIWGKGKCVLMVEDEEHIREIIKEVLTLSGLTVLESTNGREALDFYASQDHTIDLVILDLSMPVMGGKECLIELLHMDPDVTVIVTTGTSDMDEMDEILRLGAKCIINKPYTSAELLKEAQRFIR